MSDPTGPRGLGDADGFDGRPGHDVPLEEPDRGRTIPAVLVGAVAGVLALGTAWGTAVVITDARNDGGRAATSLATPGGAPSRQEPFRETSALGREDSCRQADAELAVPLRVAVPALDQWEVHVGAMNQLVAGAITPRQADAFWSQTRVGATRNLDRFHSAVRRVALAGVDCPAPGAVVRQSTGLRSCAQHVARELRALEAARVALRTWKTHIRDMQMLDLGRLSPTDATQKWLANWRRGIHELHSYRSARRAVDGGERC